MELMPPLLPAPGGAQPIPSIFRKRIGKLTEGGHSCPPKINVRRELKESSKVLPGLTVEV